MENLEQIQEELDKKKYLQSEIARTDLSGRMSYCPMCPYKSVEVGCAVEHKYRVENQFCAKAYLRGIVKDEEVKKEPEKPRKSGRKSNKKK